MDERDMESTESTKQAEQSEQMERLRELVEFLKTSGISEFDVEQPDLKMRIKFAGEPVGSPAGIDMAQLGRLMGAAAPAMVESAAVSAATASSVEEVLHEVKSPIVGTFYESASPGAAPFVKMGDVVEVGQVLCIVEAMKLMNEIESDMAGEVVRRIAASGQPVEYGQGLFAIRAT